MLKNYQEKHQFAIDGIGRLYCCNVLIWYDYPRVFICEDDTGTRFYLFWEVESGNEAAAWIVARVHGDDCAGIVNGAIPMQVPFRYKNAKPFVIRDVYNGEDIDHTDVIGDASKWLCKIPDGPTYASASPDVPLE